MNRLLSFLFCLLLWHFGWGQGVSLLEEIRSDSAVDLFLTTDWKLLERKKKEKVYFPAQLMIRRSSGDSILFAVKVRTRGHMRLDICSYPPIKLKFDKEELIRRGFKPHNEWDLVQHCHDGDQFDQYLLREYLAYRLYAILSPASFQTQLIRLHSITPENHAAHKSAICFLVENPEELVERLGGRRNKTPTISQHSIDHQSLLRVSLFQYMIGNTDWFITNRHNLEFIGLPGVPRLVSIPYDFDYSGLVGTPYSAHHESLKLISTSSRYYQGKCEPAEDVRRTVEEFVTRKELLLSVIQVIPGFDERSIRHASDYLNDFFLIIENPRKLETHILKHCDMWPVKE